VGAAARLKAAALALAARQCRAEGTAPHPLTTTTHPPTHPHACFGVVCWAPGKPGAAGWRPSWPAAEARASQAKRGRRGRACTTPLLHRCPLPTVQPLSRQLSRHPRQPTHMASLWLGPLMPQATARAMELTDPSPPPPKLGLAASRCSTRRVIVEAPLTNQTLASNTCHANAGVLYLDPWYRYILGGWPAQRYIYNSLVMNARHGCRPSGCHTSSRAVPARARGAASSQQRQ
jgi:hypothetical protein